ncbi:MAG: aspartate-semialdehyde dehydrogenase [Rhodospirillaceae bacterium BRH_c57]|nr:MAG: aspartate-semialdehyde dehydrogenase [Rhodospirillaceae bacterium BRH_c57]
MGNKIAVVGVTGAAGREILGVLSERGVIAADVVALQSGEGPGREASYGEDDVLKVLDAEKFDFSTCAVAILAVPARIATKLAPKIAAAGCVAVDTSAAFRMEQGVPLVVPGVNREALVNWAKKRIVACPSAITAQIALALAPLDGPFGLTRVLASTYQSTAGTGRDGMDELFRQTRGIYVNEPASSSKDIFTKQIAFNVIPHIDDFKKDGATEQEDGIAAEARKMFSPDLRVHANCARVPVFVGSAAYLNIETENPISVEQARAAFKNAPGLTVVDHRSDEGYVSPVECAGEDSVYISRVRRDTTSENGLSLWVVADDLRIGALNAVDVAVMLIEEKL